ncbi:MAG TPA: DcaP family trimeric outer membrane transporter [Kofleriaceae bacterium]
MRLRPWVVCGSIAFSASIAAAQPPPDEPPPPAPEPQWAPPLLEEPPSAPPPQQQEPEQAAPAPGNPSVATPSESTTAQPEERSSTMEIYGFAMLDGGYDFGAIGNPEWQDVLRPTMLPSSPDEYGHGGRTFAGVRQSRFGTKTDTPTAVGDIKTVFEWELFGVGVDAGQTTFRLRHAYGKWRGLRAGQTWSPFMDPDVFPDSVEYWGPPGMAFFRNVQLAYSFWEAGDSDFTVAVERPGATADQSSIEDRIDLTNVVPRFPAPDVSADLKLASWWGYFRISGIFRYMRWDVLGTESPGISPGHVVGGGVNVSGNIKLDPALIKLQLVYGSAIENYMNDAGPDVGPKTIDPVTISTITGTGLQVLGLVAFVDLKWCDALTSTAGYSLVWIDNSADQAATSFHMGQYALGNLLFHPTKSLLFGPEFQYGRRTNAFDGFSSNDYRLQFSVKYNFSHTVGGH